MNYRTKEEIQKRVQEHYDWAVSAGYEVVGVFLQGSWNYGDHMSDDESDVDTKCIVLPKFEDICLNKKPVSTTHIMPNNEHCDVKDIRLYFECFKKQNINFVEILFTDYYVINPMYQDEVDLLFAHKEQIAHYFPTAAIKTMFGMAMEKQKALCHPYPTLIDKINKFGYDGKQLCHIYRMHEFAERYIAGEDYAACLKSKYAGPLLLVKRNLVPWTVAEAKNRAASSCEALREMKDKYIEEHPRQKPNLEVDKLLSHILVKILKKSLIDNPKIKDVYIKENEQ